MGMKTEYRLLAEGEEIKPGDEFLGDDGNWKKTERCVGEKTPNPVYTSHRQYRRRICGECGGDHDTSGARIDCIRHWKRRAIEAENKLNVVKCYGAEGINPL
jgi:hypothetical protein